MSTDSPDVFFKFYQIIILKGLDRTWETIACLKFTEGYKM